MGFNNIFLALLREAEFTKEMLGSGATQIRKANYSSKGIYYQSFTSLSTGLERIGKLCLMLDYYISTNGKFPNMNYMKNNIGHDLEKIYGKSVEIAMRRNVTYRYLDNLDDEIHQSILKILSDFSKGDRYSNINILVSPDQQKSDSMNRWYKEVDLKIFDKHVSDAKKEKIIKNARIVEKMTQGIMMVHYVSEEGKIINDVETASIRTGMQEAVSKYRQLYVIQIIRYWVELVIDLSYEAMKIETGDIPYLSEIFGYFYNPDDYIKTRKTWDKI